MINIAWWCVLKCPSRIQMFHNKDTFSLSFASTNWMILSVGNTDNPCITDEHQQSVYWYGGASFIWNENCQLRIPKDPLRPLPLWKLIESNKRWLMYFHSVPTKWHQHQLKSKRLGCLLKSSCHDLSPLFGKEDLQSHLYMLLEHESKLAPKAELMLMPLITTVSTL